MKEQSAIAFGGWLLLVVVVGLLLAACQVGEDQCSNYDTFSQNRTARSAALIPAPENPGSVAVFDRTGSGPYLSTGSMMQLADRGTTLYVLDRKNAAVKRVDLGLGEVSAQVLVCEDARSILLAPDELTLLVACGRQGTIEFLDATDLRVADRIRVCERLDHLAQDPSGRVVYGACNHPGQVAVVVHELSLARPSSSALVVVSPDDPGPLTVRSSDGYRLWETRPLAGSIGSFVLLGESDVVAASFTRMEFTGEVGVWGDGEAVIQYGVWFVDVGTGEVAEVRLDRSGRGTLPGSPGTLAVLPGGELLVPIPGLGEVLSVRPSSQNEPSVSPPPEVKAAGLVTGRVVLGGRPEEVATAELTTETAYVLDSSRSVVTVLGENLTVLRAIPF